jgi:hypothetical protein
MGYYHKIIFRPLLKSGKLGHVIFSPVIRNADDPDCHTPLFKECFVGTV